ncbi:DUF1573 domain-containing protein [Flammeovirga yaeyamensis]|uniref:DUF1573 domain-containing protein n=1 Tax=Flammeovirga yaeyamensis TaxID=367791 RepID=A0AAX1N6Q3_9BACT|nr:MULTISPECIES: DUF1573 domain-containing protein [Flammeovirga]ANQ49362.1 DUF1573 domain-containing protein [Flammeovirga sp. MY04]MBB3697759.1 putative cupredoxin-like copper-binding protein [Flammeovirga yaeyamensis]NMF35885.1 DUF1573 domain-containing protein [Flammeovirga yaeyamensis]QWG03165.1 DUF1573 domain-containing protein [Flammeovirga yaeyamensis]
MKGKISWLVICVGILFHHSLVFGQAKIQFDKNIHDFGEIQESDGDADVVFEFTNTGNKPLTLTSVKASCGCTTPDWSTDPVAPNAKGYINVKYSTKSRPGKFNKTISVRTNGTPQVLLLSIKGNVIPRPKGPKDWYPMEMGSLRFKTTHFVFNNIKNTEKDTLSTIIYNQTKNPIELYYDQVKLPKHMAFWGDKSTVAAEDTLVVYLSYDASQKTDYGYIFEYFQLPTSDVKQPKKRINISAHIKEDFSSVADKKAEWPKATFDKKKHDFGEMKALDKASTMFTIKNDGKTKLLIRKVKASCGCTATKPNKTELAPGESTTLDVTFTAGNYNRSVTKSITVITNDPDHPENTLQISADVKSAEE